jgi:hypothetical protein
MSFAAPDNGILLALAHSQDDLDVGSACLPSMSFARPALRPRLVVTHTTPTGAAP